MSLIESALRERYKAPAWAIFFNVSNGTGGNLQGYADALAMSLFPSRGLDLHGFEVKTDRQDWLNELKNPEKAERFAKFCRFWWLVIGDEKVAKKEEIPPPWGVLVMSGKSLRQAKAPKPMDPEPVGYPFLAAVLRRANEAADDERKKASDKRSMDQAVRDAYERGRKSGTEQGREEVKDESRRYDSLKMNLADFEEKSGIKISSWNGGKIGEAVNALLDLRQRDASVELDALVNTLERVAQDFREKSKALKEALKRKP